MQGKEIGIVLVIGCGGTGSQLAMPMSRYLYSLPYFKGDIVFADGDQYSEGNMTRQNFAAKFTGMNKAEYTAKAVINALPDLANQVKFVDSYLSKESLLDLIAGKKAIIINCSDNLAIRKYVEDIVLKNRTMAHICCGNELTTGQVQLSYRMENKEISPSIYKKHPEFDSENGDRSKMNCEDLTNLPGGGQIICSNMMAAALALNYLYQITNDAVLHLNKFASTSAVHFNIQLNSFADTNRKQYEIQ